ncbi:cysteine desulfurase [Caldalkalibacillus uzonensis]|uniref:Cysteine desulfurase n=1 Tax=Caldalkalibacillus uzonensis TaxID=353224 RepID=A0ABU0CTM5_9BACI|nr:cysteine desulfurase family protein [Caldalkalibacillus uzonensis]MDQ0339776.1 cysteine desulfurase [Caldalkalibacillus uzonensis]
MAVYLDNSATTPVAAEVQQALLEVVANYYGNPSSLHRIGGEAEKLMAKAREVAAHVLGVNPGELLFTSGGTESNNLAIKGVAFQYQSRGKHIITTQIEHAAVYQVCKTLEKDFGFEVTYLPVDKNGVVSVQDVEQALREDTILVSVMHVNNELGSVQPVEKIGRLLKNRPKVLFHVDDVQGVGKVPLDIKQSGIDLLSISGHKIHAPKGTGLLYVREGVRLYPLLHGGGQEQGLRSGTENVPGIVALAKALRLAKENEKVHIEHLLGLKQTLLGGLATIHGVQINTPLDKRISAPHIVNLSCPGVKPEVLVHALGERDIYVSTTSACSSRQQQHSRTLQAIGLPQTRLHSALRVSMSVYNTKEDIDYFLQTLEDILPHYQKIMKV